MWTYKKNAKEHTFVDNGEKLRDLSTWQTRKTWVFHTVVHIIHSCTQGDLWTKGEQMPFLWKFENAAILLFEKKYHALINWIMETDFWKFHKLFYGYWQQKKFENL